MRTVLRKHYKEIVAHVNPQELMGQLATRNLVTLDEQYMLLNQTFSPQKRNQLLIVALFFKDSNISVQLFYECLKAEKNHSGHQYLADLLGPDICEYENQHQVTNNRVASNSSGGGAAAAMTESEIYRLLPTLKPYWLQVAETLSAPQQMVHNITSSSQDPEEQARMFLQHYSLYSRKENIYRAIMNFAQLYTKVSQKMTCDRSLF